MSLERQIYRSQAGKFENIKGNNILLIYGSSAATPNYAKDCEIGGNFTTEFDTTLFCRCKIGGNIIVMAERPGVVIMDRFTFENFTSKSTKGVADIEVISDLAMTRLFERQYNESTTGKTDQELLSN